MSKNLIKLVKLSRDLLQKRMQSLKLESWKKLFKLSKKMITQYWKILSCSLRLRSKCKNRRSSWFKKQRLLTQNFISIWSQSEMYLSLTVLTLETSCLSY